MHVTVLLQQAVDALNVYKGGKYIDATFGGGGHSYEVCRRGGIVFALDADPAAEQRLDAAYIENLTLIRSNFENLVDVVLERGVGSVNGILFDLGLSTYELDDPARGFSFRLDGPLDMRYDINSVAMTAGELLDALNEEALANLLRDFGDVEQAAKIAKQIKKVSNWSGSSTLVLAGLIEDLVGRTSRIHPATKVFQALRMAVNDELGALERALSGCLSVLEDGGRVVVIAFHSGEDRVVKQVFRSWELKRLGQVVGDVIQPDAQELLENNKSRSAKMRVFEKVALGSKL